MLLLFFGGSSIYTVLVFQAFEGQPEIMTLIYEIGPIKDIISIRHDLLWPLFNSVYLNLISIFNIVSEFIIVLIVKLSALTDFFLQAVSQKRFNIFTAFPFYHQVTDFFTFLQSKLFYLHAQAVQLILDVKTLTLNFWISYSKITSFLVGLSSLYYFLKKIINSFLTFNSEEYLSFFNSSYAQAADYFSDTAVVHTHNKVGKNYMDSDSNKNALEPSGTLSRGRDRSRNVPGLVEAGTSSLTNNPENTTSDSLNLLKETDSQLETVKFGDAFEDKAEGKLKVILEKLAEQDSSPEAVIKKSV